MLIVYVGVFLFIFCVMYVFVKKFRTFDMQDFFLTNFHSFALVDVVFNSPTVTPVDFDKALISGQASVTVRDFDGNIVKVFTLPSVSLESSVPFSVASHSGFFKQIVVSASFGEFSSFSVVFDDACQINMDSIFS